MAGEAEQFENSAGLNTRLSESELEFDLDENTDKIASLVTSQRTSPVPGNGNRPTGAVALPTGNEPESIGTGVIHSLIASGSLTRIYKIWNQELEEFRIIKLFLSPQQVNLRKRFETEAKISAKLRHPNIVSLFSAGTWKGYPFIEMEYVNGESLAQVLQRMGRLPERVCLSIAVSIARALAFAHSREIILYGKKYRGIIHRDLKPANIIISSEGHIKLTDFGVAAPPNLSIHQTIDNGLVVGTMPYFSPEQMEGAVLDQRSDIYSFGTVLYEMLTGTRTFPSESVTELIRAKTANQYQPLTAFGLDISDGLHEVVEQCLEVDKTKRFPEGTQLLNALLKVRSLSGKSSTEVVTREFISSQVPSPHKMSLSSEQEKVKKKTGSRGILIAALCAMVIVGIAAGAILYTRSIRRSSPDLQTASILQESLETDLRSAAVSGDIEKRLLTARSLMDRHLFTDAVALLEEMAQQAPENTRIALFLLDCFVALRETEKAWSIALRTDIDDANFDLVKGYLEQKRGNTAVALTLFSSATRKGSVVRNPDIIRKDAVYFSAMVLTTVSESTQAPEDMRKAIAAWEQVKKEYEATPTHGRYLNANRRLQQLLELPYE